MPALIDTSVFIDLPSLIDHLPEEVALSTVTLAELAAGTHAAGNAQQRALRQVQLQQAEQLFNPFDFDRAAARSYGLVVAAIAALPRSHSPRMADLMIAATAHSNGFDLYTRDRTDLRSLSTLLNVVVI